MTAVAEVATAPYIDQPGIYDMPEDVYHADPVPGGSLSFSGAKKLLPPSCPARFKWDHDHPPQSTQAMELGTAAHKLVLGEGATLVVVDAENWRTKAAQDQAKEARAAGKVPLLTAEYQKVQAIADAVRAHPIAGRLFDPEHGAPERSLFWQDPETGIWLRCRIDWLPFAGRTGHRMIITDLKKTVSADPDTVSRTAHNYRYFMQAPWYSDGVRALGYDSDPAFVFVFVEPEPPYLVTVAQLDEEAMEVGRSLNRLAIERYRDCTEAGLWPGYTSEIELISLPPWALRQLENL